MGVVDANLKTCTLHTNKPGNKWGANLHITAVGGGGEAWLIYKLEIQEVRCGDITEDIIKRENLYLLHGCDIAMGKVFLRRLVSHF